MPLHELDCGVVLGDLDKARRHRGSFLSDPTGFEAFVNHFHLEDILIDFDFEAKKRRREALFLGENVILVWAERLRSLLKGRATLFYLGGPDDVTLRFHLERPGDPSWFSLDNPSAIRKQRLRIYRSVGDGVERIA